MKNVKILSVLLSAAMFFSLFTPYVSANAGVVTHLFEDFDTAPGAVGQDVDGYNGWSVSTGDLSVYTLDTTAKLERDVNGSMVLALERTAAPSGSSANFTIAKGLESGAVIEGGFAKLSFRIKPVKNSGGATRTMFYIKDKSDEMTYFSIDHGASRVLTPAGNSYFTGVSSNTVQTAGVWYSYSIIFDLTQGSYEVYDDGGLIRSGSEYGSGNFNFDNNSISGIFISPSRAEGVSGSKVYLDNIKLEELNEESMANSVLDELTDFYEGQNILSSSISLKTEGAAGSVIDWETKNPGVISENGTVYRSGKDQRATLTAGVTLGGTYVTRDINLNVLSENTYLYEDFEAPSFTNIPAVAGRVSTGWGGWHTSNSGATYDIDTHFDVKESLYGKSLSIYRSGCTANSSLVALRKNVEEMPQGGKVSYKFSFYKASTAASAQYFFFNFTGMVEGTAITDYIKLRLDSSGSGFYAKTATGETGRFFMKDVTTGTTFPAGKWYDFEVLMDFDNNTYSVYQEGALLQGGIELLNTSKKLDNISFHPVRYDTSVGGAGAEFYIDNISVKKITDDQVCQSAIESFGNISGPVSEDIYLPGVYNTPYGNVVVSWVSDTPEVLGADGTVTRGLTSKNVKLTATVTAGEATKTQSYMVKVLGENTLIDESFDIPEVGDGTGINGYNGWVFSDTDNASYYSDSVYTVDTFEGNKVFKMYRENGDATIGERGPGFASTTKAFESVSEGVLNLSFKLMRNDTALRFTVFAGETYFSMDLGGGRILTASQNNPSFTSFNMKEAAEPDIWHDFRIRMDLDAGRFTFYMNGQELSEDVLSQKPAGGIGRMQIYATRTGNGAGAVFLVDDVKLTKSLNHPYSISVSRLDFADKDGNASGEPTALGKITGVTVRAASDKTAGRVLVAVYDSLGSLYSVGIGAVAEGELLYNQEKDISLSVSLPGEGEIQGAVIKVISVNNLNELTPIAGAYIYD